MLAVALVAVLIFAILELVECYLQLEHGTSMWNRAIGDTRPSFKPRMNPDHGQRSKKGEGQQ